MSLLTIACSIAALSLPTAAHAADVVLTHARIYTSPGTPALEDATLRLRDGRIFAINGTASTPQAGEIELDCTGLTVTAGLWNSHVHILPVKLLHADQKTDAALTAALQEMLTHWGFTTVFDVASILANTNEIRRRIASGAVLGPRILTTGEPFFPPNGVPSYVKDYLQQNQIVIPDDKTTAAAVARVDREVQLGADGIKIFAGAVEGPNVLPMPLERARAIVAEAHRLKRPTFAHPSNAVGIDIALDSGVDVLAHVTSDDQPWTPALIQRLLAAHMAITPTLTLFDVEAKKGGASPARAAQIVDRAVGRLRAYAAAGGEVLFGTDVGYMYQFDTREEYVLLQRAGLSFDRILAALTTAPAHRFGFEGRSGRIAPGLDADLTVFAGDPALDITALARVRYTLRAGIVIYDSRVKP